MKILRFETIDSTNTFAKQLCRQKPAETETLLITARQQTAGRGRTGKSFSSLRDNGLFMTVAFPVKERPENCLFLTMATAVAVYQGLTEAGCSGLGIKWVNDLYLNQRKVCGILAEAVTDPDSGCMHHVVIGVGINIGADLTLLPRDLQKKAGTIPLLPVSNEKLSVRLAEKIRQLALTCLHDENLRKQTMETYRKLSILTGRRVAWDVPEGEKSGIAAGIDDEGRLLVDTEAGRECLDSGYISVVF